MFTRIYFDGTIETAGNVCVACTRDGQVWLVVPRNCDDETLTIASSFCDTFGSLGHFEQTRYIKHQSKGSARLVSTKTDGVELFFSWLANHRAPEEAKLELIGKFYACRCHTDTTNATCVMCCHVDTVAQSYGFYDVLELVRSVE
mgnify:CR=1 FL=1